MLIRSYRRSGYCRGNRPGHRRPRPRRAGALGDRADPPDTIRGDLPVSASLSNVWQALHDSLGVIRARATLPASSPPLPSDPDKPGHPGNEAAQNERDGTRAGPACDQRSLSPNVLALSGERRNFPFCRPADHVLAEDLGGWQQAPLGRPHQADLPHRSAVPDLPVEDRPGCRFRCTRARRGQDRYA